jgi:iron complex transport system substrate-binding protein
VRQCVLTAVILLSAGTAATQMRFADDARRDVQLPSRVNRVFAAGAPAEVLLYTLVPEKLPGRNRLPEGDAVEFFPPAYRTPVLIRQLPEVDNPAADAELLALKPDVYVDYGTVDEDYIASVDAVQRRTRVPGIILEGALTRIPETYRRLGAALGAAERGNRLAATAAVEVPRRPRTIDEIRALAPDAVVVMGAGAAARLRANPAWQSVGAVASGRVFQYPGSPYSWGARPPSVNRLPGLVWLAYTLSARPFDAQFDADIRGFFKDFYHLELTEQQLRKLVAGS